MIRHVHFLWSTKNRYIMLDATVTGKSSHVLQPYWMNNASGCDAHFEQHRKTHLIDETYCSCVCFWVFHVDLCGRAVHDFDGTLHADTNDFTSTLGHCIPKLIRWSWELRAGGHQLPRFTEVSRLRTFGFGPWSVLHKCVKKCRQIFYNLDEGHLENTSMPRWRDRHLPGQIWPQFQISSLLQCVHTS